MLKMADHPMQAGRKEDKRMTRQCTHLSMIPWVRPSAQGCEECLKTGDTWVHLRICLVCGHGGGCDELPNQHARWHFEANNHLLIQSFERGENWLWCFEGELQPPPRQAAQ